MKVDELKKMFRALHHRNYRLFFMGQMISVIGTWMQMVALSWLTYRLTGSVMLLGIVGFLGQIPVLVIAPLAGVFIDRWNKHKVIIITQILSMLQAAVLTVLVFTDTIKVWQIITLSAFMGIVYSFDIPARQAFTIEMIRGREDLGNAIALNSSLWNAARLIGPSIAGLMIATAGEATCFLLNALSYIAVIIGLLKMDVTHIARRARPVAQELKEGFFYTFKSKQIRSIMVIVALISMLGMSYQVIMPAFTKEIIQGEASSYGFLLGAAGIGALIGAMFLALKTKTEGLDKIIAITATIAGIGLIAASFSNTIYFALPMMLVIGFGLTSQMAASTTILQTIVEDDKRGRVMAIYAMAFSGMAPIGNLIGGSLAQTLGIRATLTISGASCMIVALWFYTNFNRQAKA